MIVTGKQLMPSCPFPRNYLEFIEVDINGKREIIPFNSLERLVEDEYNQARELREEMDNEIS